VRRRNQTVLAVTGAALLGAAGLMATILATPPARSDPWDDWSTLLLQVKARPFLSGRIELALDKEQGKTVLKTHTVARFLGARVAQSWTSTVIDPATGHTQRYESYSKKRGRVYVFGPDGYAVEKLRPLPASTRSKEEWETYSREEYAYPVGEDGSPVAVYDYYGMLLQLRREKLHEPGDEALLFVATSSGPKPFRIQVGESASAPLTFNDLRSGEKRTLTVRKLRLRVIPADPDETDEGFLKMEGETELWVEADSKAVLMLAGNAPKIPGRIRLELQEAG